MGCVVSGFTAKLGIGALNVPVIQFAVALGMTIVAVAPWFLVPHPFLPVGSAMLLLGLTLALYRPFPMCLIFVLVSCFRLHEVFPQLEPLKLPLYFGAIALAATVWHLTIGRTIEMIWSTEAKALLVFFLLVTVGLVFAKTRALALEAWQVSFVKVVGIAFVLMWIMRVSAEFEWAARGIVLSGCLLAGVAIANKLNGVGLVEGTRITVGRDIGSPLGDPNVLALTLLFPIGFAMALMCTRTGWFNRVLGLMGFALALVALVFTQSRGGLIGVLAVAAVLGWRKIPSRSLLIVAAVLGAAALYAAMDISGRISGGAGDVDDEAAVSRLYSWGAAVNMALARPLTGVGLGNFESEYIFFTPVWIRQTFTAHSIWFLVLGEIGIPGLVAFCIMIWSALRSGLKSLRIFEQVHAEPRLQAVALGLVAGLTGFCIGGSFLSASFSWPLYIMVAMAAALARLAQQADRRFEEGRKGIEASTAIPSAPQIVSKCRWTEQNRPEYQGKKQAVTQTRNQKSNPRGRD
jgi:putative inorganic carbon (hco3(-)) transporter